MYENKHINLFIANLLSCYSIGSSYLNFFSCQLIYVNCKDLGPSIG